MNELRALARIMRRYPSARRVAVERGEVRRVWPDVLLDMAITLWWRGVYGPIVRLFTPRPPPSGCPLCRAHEDRDR